MSPSPTGAELFTTGPRSLSRTYPSSAARGMGSSRDHNLCNYFQRLNYFSLQIKTLEKVFDFPEELPLESQTSFKISQERQSMKAELKRPESLVTTEKHSLVVCVLRDCKVAGMKLPDGEIKKTILRQHPDNMQSAYIETIINFKNTG